MKYIHYYFNFSVLFKMKRKSKSTPKINANSTSLCKQCNQLYISIDCLFCPYCGSPRVDNMIIKSRTTSSYDPANPLLKPWREPPPTINLPLVRCNSYTNKTPWKPIMRQGQKRVTKTTKVVLQDNDSSQLEEDNTEEDPSEESSVIKESISIVKPLCLSDNIEGKHYSISDSSHFQVVFIFRQFHRQILSDCSLSSRLD